MISRKNELLGVLHTVLVAASVSYFVDHWFLGEAADYSILATESRRTGTHKS